MKRYTDYEAAELAALTDEQVATLIELEIAIAGIKPVFKVLPPTLAEVHITPCVVTYQVGERYFQNEDDAIEVARKPFFKLDYDYQGAGYDYKWLEPVQDTEVSKHLFYRKEDVMRVKEALAENHRKRQTYDKQNQEYNEFLKATSAIGHEVWSVVDEARKKVAEIEHAKGIFQKHLQLAEGNEEIAKNFFKAAYKGRADILEVVLGAEPEPDPPAAVPQDEEETARPKLELPSRI
ncbi:MAG TPA: hypothetical protein VM223_09435 [Planctomycetota bacterium]|nr:hypothetical protein [Planctomycetota bacterium]